MSMDYEGLCDVHRLRWHVGQQGAGHQAFGYGSKDEEGRDRVATLVFEHAACGTGVRVVPSDSAPDDYEDLDADT